MGDNQRDIKLTEQGDRTPVPVGSGVIGQASSDRQQETAQKPTQEVFFRTPVVVNATGNKSTPLKSGSSLKKPNLMKLTTCPPGRWGGTPRRYSIDGLENNVGDTRTPTGNVTYLDLT